MKAKSLMLLGVACVCVSATSFNVVSSDEPATSEPSQLQSQRTQITDSEADADAEHVVEAARDRAEVMHEVFAATLDMLHHRYFHRDRAIIPARAMQDIFSEIERQSKTEARWISASMSAMSVDHEPESDFEKRAAKEIASGRDSVEVIEDGFYRRAGAIPLGSGCIGCHGGVFKARVQKPQFAALVISVPIDAEDTTQSDPPPSNP